MTINILLTNDDGVFATGLKCLHDALCDDFTLKVVAPDRDCSGSSSSLTLKRPLQKTYFNEFVSINGTPSDCGHLGAHGLLDFEPQAIISGINQGANLGDDIIYSGTVAAAIEGRHLPITPIAVSLCGNKHFATAAAVIKKFISTNWQELHLPHKSILNINVPDVALADIAGFEITRLGTRHKSSKPLKIESPRGDVGYWLGNVGIPNDCSIGTDFDAIANNKVSITPLHTDLTRYDAFDAVSNWFKVYKNNTLV